MRTSIILILCVACGCSSLSQEAWQLSIETNTVMMHKYNKISTEFRAFMMYVKGQLEDEGKSVGGIPEWIDDLDKDDADVIKIAKAYKAMVQSGVMEPTPWLEAGLEMADALISLKEKHDG